VLHVAHTLIPANSKDTAPAPRCLGYLTFVLLTVYFVANVAAIAIAIAITIECWPKVSRCRFQRFQYRWMAAEPTYLDLMAKCSFVIIDRCRTFAILIGGLHKMSCSLGYDLAFMYIRLSFQPSVCAWASKVNFSWLCMAIKALMIYVFAAMDLI